MYAILSPYSGDGDRQPLELSTDAETKAFKVVSAFLQTE